KKEINEGIPWDKRQKVGRDHNSCGAMMMEARQMRIRSALNSSTSSMGQEDVLLGSPNGHSDFAVPVEFCKENVDALLSMKMKGKTKFDYKGKCEQMAEYIRKLRTCIRWFQELEESYVTDKEQLQKDLINEKRERKETEDEMKKKEEELQMSIAEFRETCFSLQEKTSKAESDREASIQGRQKDIEARISAEKAQVCLSEERDKARQEAFSANQQVTSLQDINKRLQEYNTSLQHYNSKLQSDAATSAETISRLQKEKSTMMETLCSLRGHTTALQDQLSVTKASLQEAQKERKGFAEEIERLRGVLQRTADDRDHYVAQAQTLSVEVTKYKECTGKTAAELEQLTNKTTYLQENFSSQSEQIRSLQQRLDIANKRAEVAEFSALQLKSQCAEQHQKIEELQGRLAEADIQNFEGELLRRKLHNTILELKGNIRVFCRVRPLLPDDQCTSESSVVVYPTSTELLGRGIDLIQNPVQKHSFTFDKVFGHESKQEEVFVEISQLVQSALDGYKVCIFAYGQTGSGKTYTMLGKPDAPEQKGIIPRSLEQIFKTSQALSSQGWSFRMQASMLEIYNETIRDLLVTNKNGSLDGTRSENKQYAIKHDQNGNSFVSDLTITDVNNWIEVSSLLHKAAQSRTVGKTLMNEQSSRSHCVFTLRISGVNESTDQQVHGVLNLIDLAGSERLSRSCSTGDRLKETQAINKSLACLGDVILAIANREQHVPYRNSKLTYLLQPCLGGDSKTLMFVNISPDASSLNESICSLRFAAKDRSEYRRLDMLVYRVIDMRFTHVFVSSKGIRLLTSFDEILPTSIDKETTRLVFNECIGLPLALKVIGQVMAGIIDLNEWKFALKMLQNAEIYGDVIDKLFVRLRLSYDALADFDVALQLCFLYLFAFPKDEVIFTRYVSQLWIGEGFVTRQDPLQIGQRFVKLLVDRCLLEQLLKDYDRKVVFFRVHDMLHNLVQQIAEKDEKCFFRAGTNLQEFPADDCSAHFRISLMGNNLTNVPNTFESSHNCSWVMRNNLDLTKIPQQLDKLEVLPVVEEGAMPSLKTLTIMECEALQMLSESYWNLKSVEKIRVYGCTMVLDIIEIPIMTNVQTIALSTIDTQAWQERFREMTDRDEDMLYSEFWSNELLHEWKVFAQLLPGNNTSLDSLEMLGKRDFNIHNNWNIPDVPPNLQITGSSFIEREIQT
ncbi:hypothetical protein KI387_019057, partial [Taxus chinensis]